MGDRFVGEPSRSPGTFDPGTVDPGTVDPGTVDPGTVDPGTVEPGTVEPGTVDPGTVDPGRVGPGAADEPAERVRLGVAGLRRRMTVVRQGGPADHALAAGLLSVDVASAYRGALFARDRAAAEFAVESIVDPAPAVEGELAAAQARVEELRELLTESRRLAAAHLRSDPGDPAHPGDPLSEADPATGGGSVSGGGSAGEGGLAREGRLALRGDADRPGGLETGDGAQARLRAIAGQLRLLDLYRVQLIAGRNLAAAELVEHAGWPLEKAAALARTAPEPVAAARWAAVVQPPGHADAQTVTELTDLLDALAERTRALTTLRDETIRGLVDRVMIQLSGEHCTFLRNAHR